MNKHFKQLMSVTLCLMLCLSLCAAAFAAEPVDLVLTLDTASAETGSLPETVSMRVATTEELSLAVYGGEAYAEDSRITIKEILDGDRELSAAVAATGRFGVASGTDKPVTHWATVVFSIPADLPAGDYVMGVRDTNNSNVAGDRPLRVGAGKEITFHVTNASVSVTGVSLNKHYASMLVGDSQTLTATVTPENADNKNVTWSTSDARIATVNDGIVTAAGEGTAEITVTTEDGGHTDRCFVTVSNVPVAATGVELSPETLTLEAGKSSQLTATFKPTDATNQNVTWKSSDPTVASVDANGRVRAIAEGAATITVTTEDGGFTATCEVTVTPKNNNNDSLMAGGLIISGLGSGELPFRDVTFRNYYYDAVRWAVDRGITSGTSRNTFGPDEACTRAQVVTFLWRAAGRPQPVSKTNPFTDVHADDYFYDAVLWAVENGITKGTSDRTFSPDEAVTRAQVVTFLWRANGQNSAVSSGFTDVSASAYYAKAVDWAFANGVTTGMDYGAFGPDTACTRAQIVTFLYRAR